MLVDGVVLKQVMDLDVSHFCQEVLSASTTETVSIPRPVRTADGTWSAGGWIATTFVHGLISARNDPALLLEVGLELAEALPATATLDVTAVVARSDRWAIAERFTSAKPTCRCRPMRP